jgi:2-polyprenyl-3-methyl-5-hydroxy-6-metoxy-1,4-benzoquinol methylase
VRITPEYQQLNRDMHQASETFGSHGHRWANNVATVAQMMNSTSILDYGCGKGTLAKALQLPVREYDPAIPGKDAEPAPADLVVCTDVLEHIEPECLDAVLDHIVSLAKRIAFFTIHCSAAEKSLPDGRNAHLIQKDIPWWMAKINDRFVIAQSQIAGPHTLWIMGRTHAEHERIVTEGPKR